MEQRKHIFYTQDKDEQYAIFIFFCVKLHLRKDEIIWMRDAIKSLYEDDIDLEDKKGTIKAFEQKLMGDKKKERKRKKAVQLANNYGTQFDIVDYANYCKKRNIVF